MVNSYSLKVIFTRLTFGLLVATCWLLYKYDLTDYIVLIFLVLVFGGLFTISTVDLYSKEIYIKKSYFWGLFPIRRRVAYDYMLSIQTKKYEIDTNDDAGMFTDGIFSLPFLDFVKSRIIWVTAKLSYIDNGKNQDIELKLTNEAFRKIEREIAMNDDYRSFGRRR